MGLTKAISGNLMPLRGADKKRQQHSGSEARDELRSPVFLSGQRQAPLANEEMKNILLKRLT